MATVGKLIVIKSKTVQVEFTNPKGKEVRMPIADNQLSTRLSQAKEYNINDLEGIEVELDVVAGQPKNVREKGDKYHTLM